MTTSPVSAGAQMVMRRNIAHRGHHIGMSQRHGLRPAGRAARVRQEGDVPGQGSSRRAPSGRLPLPGDIALLTHTSGTTGRPKAVPLTHANVMPPLRNISAHYHLSPADTGLVVMPLFHGHGLIGRPHFRAFRRR